MSYIKIDGLNIHYERVGNDSGRDVVLLHGWGSQLEIFKHIVRKLEPDFRVYALDFPGFGGSNAPNEEWGVNDYTLFLEAFVKEFNIQNPILMGHSFGGRVAILYSSRNEVNKLVLIDSAGIKPARSFKYYLKVYSFKLSKRILPVLLGKEKANILIEQYRKKSGSSDYNAAAGIMRKILVKVVNEDLKRVMPQIKAPTLLIWGENDTAAPVKDARIMEKLIKDSGLVVLKNTGHFSFIEKPGEVNIILDAFLNDDKPK